MGKRFNQELLHSNFNILQEGSRSYYERLRREIKEVKDDARRKRAEIVETPISPHEQKRRSELLLEQKIKSELPPGRYYPDGTLCEGQKLMLDFFHVAQDKSVTTRQLFCETLDLFRQIIKSGYHILTPEIKEKFRQEKIKSMVGWQIVNFLDETLPEPELLRCENCGRDDFLSQAAFFGHKGQCKKTRVKE